MKNIIFIVIFISIICSSFTLHIDDDIWNDDIWNDDIWNDDIWNEQKNPKLFKKEENNNKNFDVKVSVIIPTFNNEKLIGRSIESALNQTLKEIEIIVVDDCSNDTTGSIVEEYKKKDNRIKLITNKVNMGVGISRNKALKKAEGEFIGFIDSDDYVDPGWFQNMYDNSKDMDLVRGIRVLHDFSDTYYKNETKPYGCIVPSIIRKSFLDENKIEFPNNRRYEDTIFRKRLQSKKPRIYLLPDNGIYYHYCKREGSLSNYINPNKNNTPIETQTIETSNLIFKMNGGPTFEKVNMTSIAIISIIFIIVPIFKTIILS